MTAVSKWHPLLCVGYYNEIQWGITHHEAHCADLFADTKKNMVEYMFCVSANLNQHNGV